MVELQRYVDEMCFRLGILVVVFERDVTFQHKIEKKNYKWADFETLIATINGLKLN